MCIYWLEIHNIDLLFVSIAGRPKRFPVKCVWAAPRRSSNSRPPLLPPLVGALRNQADFERHNHQTDCQQFPRPPKLVRARPPERRARDQTQSRPSSLVQPAHCHGLLFASVSYLIYLLCELARLLVLVVVVLAVVVAVVAVQRRRPTTIGAPQTQSAAVATCNWETIRPARVMVGQHIASHADVCYPAGWLACLLGSAGWMCCRPVGLIQHVDKHLIMTSATTLVPGGPSAPDGWPVQVHCRPWGSQSEMIPQPGKC